MLRKAEDRSRLRATGVLVSAAGDFAETATRGKPSGRRLYQTPGEEAWSPLSPLGCHRILLKNAKGTNFQEWGAMGKKRGCPSVGFPPIIVADNWLHHGRGLAFVPTFHLTTTHCSAAGQEEHWQSQQGEKPGGSDPGNPAMQSNSDSESLWLVSFGHKSIPSSIIRPHPGEDGERGEGT